MKEEIRSPKTLPNGDAKADSKDKKMRRGRAGQSSFTAQILPITDPSPTSTRRPDERDSLSLLRDAD